MRFSPRQASAFALCRLWILISAGRRSAVVPPFGQLEGPSCRDRSVDLHLLGGYGLRARVGVWGGAALLCAGGVFAWIVFASGHRSALREQEGVRHPGNRDEYLARVADCVACHSAPGGKAFAGGLKMGTPLGAIYSTNITPDPDTGTGAYSLADFDRAVRLGI